MTEPANNDDVDELLVRILEGRLQATFDAFCARIPELLAGLRDAGGPSPAGREFVRALLAWVGDAGREHERAGRYLLVWYARSLARRGAAAGPDAVDVVALLRGHLSPAELADVDRALARDWDSGARGHRLRFLAERRRREFRDSLTDAQRERFAPYLACFLPVLTPPSVASSAASAAGDGATVATLSTAARVGGGVLAAKATLVLGLPVLAATTWFVARGAGVDAGSAHVGSIEAHPARRPASSSADGLSPGGAVPAAIAAQTPTRPAVDAVAARGPLASDDRMFTWTRRSSGTDSDLVAVTWGDGRAVIVGADGAILSSTDGVVWTSTPQATLHVYGAVTHGGGRFVAVGTSRGGSHLGRLIATSTDGMHWAAQGWQERTGLGGVAYGHGAFVAVGNRGAIVRSTDGERWDTVAPPSGEGLAAVAFIGERFLALGEDGAVLSSADGVAWSVAARTLPHAHQHLAHAPGTYATVGVRQAPDGAEVGVVGLATSPEAWTERDVPGTEGLHGVVVIGDAVVAGGRAGVVSSADGVTWRTEVPAAELSSVSDVVWTGTQVIAVGAGGAVFTGVPRAERSTNGH